MLDESNEIIQQTQNWIRSFIIKFNICPFAKREINREAVRFQVTLTKKEALAFTEFMAEIDLLDRQPEIETSLLIFPSLFKDFFHYLDFVDMAEQLLLDSGYEGVYQLATFHPDYCFADVDINDVSNYTNRSPYPMLHILREESVEKAIDYYGDTSIIPENNIVTMQQLGLETVKKLLLDCMNSTQAP